VVDILRIEAGIEERGVAKHQGGEDGHQRMAPRRP
jgi:hypothetical protein